VVEHLHAFLISVQVEMPDQHGNVSHQTGLEADVTSLKRVVSQSIHGNREEKHE
jgi:hypothetical protein